MRLKSLVLKLLVSMALLALLAVHVDRAELVQVASGTRIEVWAAAIAFILMQMFAQSVRWVLLVDTKTRKTGMRNSWLITAVSFLANYLFITSLGGIIARVALAVNLGFSFVRALTATAVDRVFTLGGLVVLTGMFLPLTYNFINERMIEMTAILFAVGLIVLAVVYWKRRTIIFWNRKVTLAVRYLRQLLINPLRLGKIVIVTLVAQVLFFASVYILLKGVHVEFSFVKFMAIMPLITLVSSLPAGYGGWGVREGAFVYGLGLIGIPAEIALVAGIQTGIVGMLTAFMTGIPALLQINPDFRMRLRRRIF